METGWYDLLTLVSPPKGSRNQQPAHRAAGRWGALQSLGSDLPQQEPHLCARTRNLTRSQRPFGKQTEGKLGVSVYRVQAKTPLRETAESLTHQIRLSYYVFSLLQAAHLSLFFFFLSQLHFLLSFFILLQLCTGLGCGTRGLRCITRNLPLWHRDSPAVPLQLPSVCAPVVAAHGLGSLLRLWDLSFPTRDRTPSPAFPQSFHSFYVCALWC